MMVLKIATNNPCECGYKMIDLDNFDHDDHSHQTQEDL
jgi:hypothetical protein